MQTGDVHEKLTRLLLLLRALRFPPETDVDGLRDGNPTVFVSLLRHALLRFSRRVSRRLLAAGHELEAKDDRRFVECALKACRVSFGHRAALSPAQCMTPGAFVEQKAILLCEVLELCRRTHNELSKEQRQSHARPGPAGQPLNSAARARALSPAAPAEQPSSLGIAIEVLPGSAVRSTVQRARPTDASGRAQPAPELANDFSRTAPSSRASYVPEQPCSAPWSRSESAAGSRHGGEAAEPEALSLLVLAAELRARLGSMESALRRLDVRLLSLEAARDEPAAALDGDARQNTRAPVPAQLFGVPAAAPAAQAGAQRGLDAAFMPSVSVPGHDEAHELRAFIEAVALRLEETRALLGT